MAKPNPKPKPDADDAPESPPASPAPIPTHVGFRGPFAGRDWESKDHEFYAYHDGPKVYARWGNRKPVVAETLDSPQAAHDRVQEIVNPDGLRHDDRKLGNQGFNHPDFQAGLSARCEAFVRAAYGRAED
jgi:hypothetical protein